jgi:uncharacterized glyoxalase superfamily protein PhnB
MFNGQCEEALNFYSKTLGGDIKHLSRFEGSQAESMTDDKQKILHASFEAGEVTFIASDSGMVHLTLELQKEKDAGKVFKRPMRLLMAAIKNGSK